MIWVQTRGIKALVVLDVTAHLVKQAVVRNGAAAIPLNAARMRGNGACGEAARDGDRITGVLDVPTGSILVYRWRSDRISVTVEPKPAAGPTGEASGTGEVRLIWFDAERNEHTCVLPARSAFEMERSSLSVAQPLPIAGPTEVGLEIGVPIAQSADGAPQASLLLRGEVSVFGRATLSSSAIFPITGEPIMIPSGSRITSTVDGSLEGGAPWYGVVFVEDDGFRISATTDTSDLYIFRPGQSERQYEHLEIGLFRWLFSDPSLAWISTGLLIMVLTIQTVGTGLALLPTDEDRKRNGCRPGPKRGPS
ncbi:hypothetical protein L1787_23690 [Acuticoccus sp. M5D2P5]|uniref:hypothetical protein n=1 Tax=Acuticoccus kalidii TaxID=2910977 RepID=UPI001F22F2EF|nr:hypothetical protein [Acuticoccus kalidii]MCF3936400.1 hypothetical protein [Acuticoccus kalidii]